MILWDIWVIHFAAFKVNIGREKEINFKLNIGIETLDLKNLLRNLLATTNNFGKRIGV